MSIGVELVLVIRLNFLVLPKVELTLTEGVHVALRMKYSEPNFNQLNGSIV